MPAFGRSFPTQTLSGWNAMHPGNAVRALFDRWALPGCAATGDKMLRLGIRDGYLNFYIKGQSVAKFSCGRDGPHLSVHEAYVNGRPADGSDERSAGQTYRTFDAKSLAKPETAALVAGWIKTALTYASAEKRFVDELVAANGGVIDLEMGLPASDLLGSARVAPRMDLVVAEVADGIAAVVFWEAKCANNGELRSSREYLRLDGDAFNGPKVLNQLSKYVRWMEEPGRLEQVRAACRATGSILLDLYRAFRAPASEEAPACLSVWESLSRGPESVIVTQPGLVIGNYWPEGSTEGIASGRMGQCARSFTRNGHLAKLEVAGVRVHEVGPDHNPAVLPSLAAAVAA